MEEKLLEEVIDCLPRNRSLFHYHKDQYVVYLLTYFSGNFANLSISSIRQSSLGKLLNKPALAELLKQAGGGFIDSRALDYLWHMQSEQYVLTLGKWGHKSNYAWNQTSRPGMNLVLQLNLKSQYESAFSAFSGCKINDMTYSGHPASHKRTATLAWARLDMDFTTGEVLIEEIQSDLIRDLESMHKRALLCRRRERAQVYWRSHFLDNLKLTQYCEQVLATQKKIWSEAMLAATLWFVHQELGFNKVYYHTFDTGKVLKKIVGCAPPRSLYTDLPEQFCFQRTAQAPAFIANDKKAQLRIKAANNPEWYLLAG